jgi:D-3-phosphoglycerate dehydrogenase
MIFFTNQDQPGVIGQIGTILGKGNVNIAGMQLGRECQGGKALSLLLVDDPVSSEVIRQIERIDGILTARVVKV